MSDGLANHSVDASATRESVSAVKMLYIVQRNLAGSSCRGYRSVSQRTSLAQCEDSRRQAGFSHRNGDKIFGASREAQKPNAVLNAPRFRRNLHSIDATVGRRAHGARQIRRAIKVMYGKHDAGRHGIFPNGLAGKFAQGFQFEIAPLATGFASLNQPVEFAVDASGEFASTLAAAAGGDKCGRPNFAFFQPGEEPRALQVAAQPIETQLDGLCSP